MARTRSTRKQQADAKNLQNGCVGCLTLIGIVSIICIVLFSKSRSQEEPNTPTVTSQVSVSKETTDNILSDDPQDTSPVEVPQQPATPSQGINSLVSSSQETIQEPTLTDPDTYTLVQIVDGDTVKIKDAKGTEYSVRMIGLDAPESSTTRYGYAECFGKEATNHLKSLIGSATTIRLEPDETQMKTDKYGRLLGYVIINGMNVNKQMIADGYAFEYTYNIPYKYQSLFKQAQKTASEKKKGLWADSACSGDRKYGVSTASQPATQKTTPEPVEIQKPTPAPVAPSPKTTAEKIYHLGPRGGCYYVSDNNTKVYVDKDLCYQ